MRFSRPIHVSVARDAQHPTVISEADGQSESPPTQPHPAYVAGGIPCLITMQASPDSCEFVCYLQCRGFVPTSRPRVVVTADDRCQPTRGFIIISWFPTSIAGQPHSFSYFGITMLPASFFFLPALEYTGACRHTTHKWKDSNVGCASTTSLTFSLHVHSDTIAGRFSVISTPKTETRLHDGGSSKLRPPRKTSKVTPVIHVARKPHTSGSLPQSSRYHYVATSWRPGLQRSGPSIDLSIDLQPPAKIKSSVRSLRNGVSINLGSKAWLLHIFR